MSDDEYMRACRPLGLQGSVETTEKRLVRTPLGVRAIDKNKSKSKI